MIVNNRRPNRFLRGIYGRDMENGIIPPFCTSLYGRWPWVAFGGLRVALTQQITLTAWPL